MGLAALNGDGVRQPPYDETIASTSCDIWVIIPDENVPPVLSEVTRGPQKLGWAQSINEGMNRPTQILRMLDKNRAGRIAAQKPNVENYTLSLNAFETYNNVLPARLAGMPGGLFKSVQSLGYPIWVVSWDVHPSDETQQSQIVWGDCWVTGWTRAKTIGTITVAGTITLSPSWVETYATNDRSLPFDYTATA